MRKLLEMWMEGENAATSRLKAVGCAIAASSMRGFLAKHLVDAATQPAHSNPMI
jgi:hypothetical protein